MPELGKQNAQMAKAVQFDFKTYSCYIKQSSGTSYGLLADTYPNKEIRNVTEYQSSEDSVTFNFNQ